MSNSNHDSPAPRVSVVMLTYQRPQLIGRAIQSVVDQHFPDWELLIVHDGPNRQTAALVGEWREREPRIRYFHRDRGGNIADATNFGLARARGEYIAILDDDDYWADADKLGKQVAFLDENPDYAGCGGGIVIIDQHGKEQLRCLKPEADGAIKRLALLANPMAHSTVVYRAGALRAIGLYDETLAGFQDWDVCLKIGHAGKLYNFPEHLAYYSIWDGGGSFHQQKKNTRSAIRIVWRHKNKYPGAAAALSLALLYHGYAHLPVWFRSASYSFLSRMKKSLVSPRKPARVPVPEA